MSNKVDLLKSLQKEEVAPQEVFYFRSFKPNLRYGKIIFTNYQLITSDHAEVALIRNDLISRNLAIELTAEEFELANTITQDVVSDPVPESLD
jgi:hypothetical protein